MDDDEPLSAEESLNLIAQQNRRTRRELGGGPARMLAAWAFAWLLGWGFTYLSTQTESIPGWVGGVLVAVLFVFAITYTGYVSARAGRGIRGPSRTVGAVTGALMMPLGMLGGLWIPLYVLPDWMATLAHFFPTYWLGRVGLEPLAHAGGMGFAALVLAGWLVIPALVVVRRFRLDTARL